MTQVTQPPVEAPPAPSLPGPGQRFVAGMFGDNPTYRQVLGMCPTLAVTGLVLGGVTMAACTMAVLVLSALIVSLIRLHLRSHLRILVFTMAIAVTVTVVDQLLAAHFFGMSQYLGPYIPLIIVNCIIIARCEIVSSKQGLLTSAADAVGQGLGFLLGLLSISVVREILSSGKLLTMPGAGETESPLLWTAFFNGKLSQVWSAVSDGSGLRLLPESWPNWGIMQAPAGAFITLGCLMGLVNWLVLWRKAKAARSRAAGGQA